MDIDVKFFKRPDTGETQLSVIAGGIIDPAGIKEILFKIAEVIEPLPGCSSLVDLRRATCCLTPDHIYALIHELKPELLPRSNRIALVSPPRIEEYDQLYMMSASLWSRGAKIEVFYDINQAVKWLSLRHVRACETRWPH